MEEDAVWVKCTRGHTWQTHRGGPQAIEDVKRGWPYAVTLSIPNLGEDLGFKDLCPHCLREKLTKVLADVGRVHVIPVQKE